MPPNTFKLAPSELTFLWDECQRCFYLKTVRNFSRPYVPFPSIFQKMDTLSKGYYSGREPSVLNARLTRGTITGAGRAVKSAPYQLPGRDSSFFISGKLDNLLDFEDGTVGVPDYKVMAPKMEHVAFYARQLEAYAWALENPEKGRAVEVSALGLYILEPTTLEEVDGRLVMGLSTTWLDIPRNIEGFLRFVDSIVQVLEADEPPPAGDRCGFCKYFDSRTAEGV